ncbi:hypothetical protein [uncultured Duncaniella sp.]|uniref:hypothetical protein n=1 Tax=uncultured Duncaniella sp. TaxID=2768039 RepID=UPI00262E117F|nr:hypothetical protein [uncultured Duncaniella sp.]
MSRIGLPAGHIPAEALACLDEALTEHGCAPVNRRDRIRNFITVPTELVESIINSYKLKMRVAT